MGLGPFALISLFYVLIGARVIFHLVRNFRQTFDRHFTHEDRMLVDQAAFFVLLPIAVALHELGHAVAIWLYGGQVLGWGFYGFAGYVAYDPREFTDAQQITIAAAGTVVNLALAGIALGLVFLKQPPFRAAINELLIQFTWISLLNALVVYPVLDLISGLNGDWTQMYSGTVPALSLAIFIVHVSILGALFWAWKSPRVRARVAQLTGMPLSPRRIAPLGRGAPRPRGLTMSPSADAATGVGSTTAKETLRDAATRVASGWPEPVEAAMQRGSHGDALVLSWGEGALQRSVMVVAADGGGVEFSGALRASGGVPEQRPIGRDPAGVLDADRLTMMLRLAMESVEGWTLSDGVEESRSRGVEQTS